MMNECPYIPIVPFLRYLLELVVISCLPVDLSTSSTCDGVDRVDGSIGSTARLPGTNSELSGPAVQSCKSPTSVCP